MVGYITAGSLQVRQPFTTDLEAASKALRIPASSVTSAPYNPYVEVIEALKKFDTGNSRNKNAILLVSDGLDVSRGFDDVRPRRGSQAIVHVPTPGDFAFENAAVFFR